MATILSHPFLPPSLPPSPSLQATIHHLLDIAVVFDVAAHEGGQEAGRIGVAHLAGLGGEGGREGGREEREVYNEWTRKEGDRKDGRREGRRAYLVQLELGVPEDVEDISVVHDAE
jgi:hypothetical protein